MASSIRRSAAAAFRRIPLKPIFTTGSTPSPYTRSFFTMTASDKEAVEYLSLFVLRGSPHCINELYKLNHPMQTAGPSQLVEVDKAKNGTLVRITLPGVGPKAVKVWAEDDTIFFSGEGETECQGDSVRKYSGSLEFKPEFNQAAGVEAKIVHGVLRLLVPYVERGGTM